MVNEISISKRLQTLIDGNNTLKENLYQIAEWLNKNYNIRLYFCEIIGGRRWSFLAGNEGVISGRKIELTDSLGVIVEDYNALDEGDWAKVFNIIRKLNQ
ncbi:hypothetical protein [Acetohalobium arabaticum]|uniref:Uncharacterized protein n=1 Tax=Acetohalobium arabaticum (strain ATCC 49924 / DSM 5501 / Z-7288) TaxID=574087 RepID=D9QQF8_ACEAZ|nr:hypothetical protein [Acetohalobium arabaticum]ADL12749.1 hypothetical protein Acear_1232 [Acetohalobium arabaticum DSM 5501]